jgi:hypothetical protein
MFHSCVRSRSGQPRLITALALDLIRARVLHLQQILDVRPNQLPTNGPTFQHAVARRSKSGRAMLPSGLGARAVPHAWARRAGGVFVAPRVAAVSTWTRTVRASDFASPFAAVLRPRVCTQSSELASTGLRRIEKGVRYCSNHKSTRMSSQDLDNQPRPEVRKYLQQSHDRIFENNKKWADEMKGKHPEFFENLSAGQSPEYLWIGECSSSTLHSLSAHKCILPV